MDISKIGNPALFGSASLKKQNELIHVKDAIPELKDKNIAVSIDISKDGLKAYREAVRNMGSASGAIDIEKQLQLREILPKVQIDPSGMYYQEMRNDINETLSDIKDNESNYNLQDIILSALDSYATIYHELQQSHKNNTRDIYVADDVTDDIQFHKVGIEEDMEYLNLAFERVARGVGIDAAMQEQRWHVNNVIHQGPKLDIELPNNYQEKIFDLMKKAQEEIIQGDFKRNLYNDSDADFWKCMNRLYERE